LKGKAESERKIMDDRLGLASRLTSLHDEYIRFILGYLSGYELCKLWMIGNKTICNRLEHNTTRFDLIYKQDTPRKWPNIICHFPRLHHLNITAVANGHPDLPLFLHGMRLSTLPSSLRTLNLDFENSISLFLHSTTTNQLYASLETADLRSRFPDLELFFCRYWNVVNRGCLNIDSNILPSKLTSLRILPHTSIDNINALPKTLTVLGTRLDPDTKIEILELPPLLTSLTLSVANSSFTLKCLPASLTALELWYTNYPETKDHQWEYLPPQLESLSMRNFGFLSAAMFKLLPQSITHLDLVFISMSPLPDCLPFLPPKLKKWSSSSLNGVSLNPWASLPPSLTEVPLQLCMNVPPQHWSCLPVNFSTLFFTIRIPNDSTLASAPAGLQSIHIGPNPLNIMEFAPFTNLQSITIADGPPLPKSATFLNRFSTLRHLSVRRRLAWNLLVDATFELESLKTQGIADNGLYDAWKDLKCLQRLRAISITQGRPPTSWFSQLPSKLQTLEIESSLLIIEANVIQNLPRTLIELSIDPITDLTTAHFGMLPPYLYSLILESKQRNLSEEHLEKVPLTVGSGRLPGIGFRSFLDSRNIPLHHPTKVDFI
jgi:hypothetical protein